MLMAGCATVLVGETRRLESASGWQSLTSLGTVLIGCGFALGVAFTAVTTARLRGGGRRRTGRGPAPAEPGSLLGGGEYWPEAGPRTGMTPPGDWTGGSAAEVAEVAGGRGAFGLDDRGAAEDWGGPGEASPVSASGGSDSGDGTRAEDWLSHLRGSGLGPGHQPGRAASPEPAAASPVPAPPADYEPLASPAAASYWPPAAPAAPAPAGMGGRSRLITSRRSRLTIGRRCRPSGPATAPRPARRSPRRPPVMSVRSRPARPVTARRPGRTRPVTGLRRTIPMKAGGSMDPTRPSRTATMRRPSRRGRRRFIIRRRGGVTTPGSSRPTTPASGARSS